MATVTMTGLKQNSKDEDNARAVNAGEALSIGDIVVVDSSDDATKLVVSTYSGDGSDIFICITAAALNEAVYVGEPADYVLAGLSEGDVLYAKGTGQVGDDFGTDVTSGDAVIVLGFYAVGGLFRHRVTYMGYAKA